MLTQTQADRLIALFKEAVRTDPLSWKVNEIANEILVSIEEKGLQFVLSLKRNPFEIRLHLRTRDRDIGLVRLDNSPYHPNPDGTEIVDQPHLHLYREGEDLAWAQPVDWYDLDDPYSTLERFLSLIHTSFPGGVQVELY
jgi:hypothetical protein